MRAILVVLSLTLLGACNMIVTKTPVFSDADRATPGLRLGVWGDAPGKDCSYDETKPFADWPSCANGALVRKTEVGSFSNSGGKRTWTVTPYLLTSGDPAVFQVQVKDFDLPGGGRLPIGYLYAGMRPTKLDDRGRIVAVGSAWIALCGPPPPTPPSDGAPSGGKPPRLGTLQPLPGLTMDDDGNNCATTSKDAVRGAAAASEKWSSMEVPSTSHWIRDGDK